MLHRMKILVTTSYSDWDPNTPQEPDPGVFDLSVELSGTTASADARCPIGSESTR